MPNSQNPKPRSEAQREAARRNGAKSKGPVTPMGKAISSRNALRHGLEASDISLTSENPEAFSEVLSEYMDEYRPVGPTETTLVEHLAIAHFRLYRAWTSETALYNMEMAENDERLTKKYTYMAPPVRTADATETLLARSNALPHVYRCQAAVNREYYRALNQLLALRKPPKPARKATAKSLEIAETNPATMLETQEIALAETPEPEPAPETLSKPNQKALPMPLAAAILAICALALAGAKATASTHTTIQGMTPFAALFHTLLLASDVSSLQSAIYFEPNLGQFDPKIRFLARSTQSRIWITDREILLEAPVSVAPNANANASVRIGFAPTRKTPRRAQGLEKQQGISNYFLGNRPNRWIQNVPSFAKARLEEIYPGIDIVFYSAKSKTGQHLEYDFVVKPGADPSQISVDFDPKLKPRISPQDPTLISMELPHGRIDHRIPSVHQNERPIAFEPVWNGHAMRFRLGQYDHSQTLTVDPVILYSTFLAGATNDIPRNMAIDPTGAAYVTGETKSLDHPAVNFESQPKFTGNDCFVTKFSATPDNTGIYPRVYSTYLGGSDSEICTGLAVDATGAAYIAGATFSSNFPTKAAFQTQPGAIFITKLSAQPVTGGNYGIVYSTYFQELQNVGRVRIAVDPSGAAYVASTQDRPRLEVLNAAQPTWGGDSDIVVLKIAATPAAGIYQRIYTTHLGGSGPDFDASIAVDSTGAAYIGGTTGSRNFPTIAAFQTNIPGQGCGFLTKISASPNQIGVYPFEYSSYLCGTSNSLTADRVTAVAVDAEATLYATGTSRSTDFPVLNPLPESPATGYLVKVAPRPSGNRFPLLMSTPFGGMFRDTTPAALSVSPDGATVAIAGESRANTGSAVFAQVDPPFEAPNQLAFTAFVVKYNLTARNTIFSTTLPASTNIGVALDAAGNTYVSGSGGDLKQDILNGYTAETFGFLMKLGTQPSPIAVTITANQPGPISFTISGAGCRPGTYTAPSSFRWPNGRDCTISFEPVQTNTASRFTFQKWTDNNSTATTRVIRAGAAPVSFEMQFEEEFSLETDAFPPGSGTTTPAVKSFHKAGTVVPITATPNPGWAFQTWLSSAVTNFTSPTASITMRNPNQLRAQFAPAPINNNGLLFVPVTPCRVADTRNTPGPLGQPALVGKQTRGFPVPSGPCGIPANAAAYSVNVTVVPRGPLGFLSIWPTGSEQPVVSTLNSLDGRIKANAALVPAGTGGAVSVYATDNTDFILDINGYFALPPQTNGLMFYSIPPCRVIDTRLATGPLGGPSLVANTKRSIPVRSSNCAIPANARAYAMNTTVVPSGPLGFLSMWPTGSDQPVVSTINALTGTVTANTAIVPAGTDSSGSIDVFATDRTHLIVDINGYFAPPGATGGQKFYTMTPCRIYDSRFPNQFANGPLGNPQASTYRFDVIVRSPCSISAAAQTYSLSATVVPRGVFGFLTFWPNSQPPTDPPTVSALNAIDGAITSNAVIVPAGFLGIFNVFVTDPTELILDINGFFAP
jgi:hypothetical protein